MQYVGGVGTSAVLQHLDVDVTDRIDTVAVLDLDPAGHLLEERAP
jgi:hypothetical protein